ncbi:pleckstrin homology domain-containing family G member 5-like [Protopterus annectens]|uniref:pleckstrin homology domain-containing family G member 5-like n=1 Tax=Protopterus annectens TaxID=7888 RepID=UPI001CFB5E03|nr:pleckstrin homology domain-containing family G member 5-like [Protopterus annectens]
MNFSVRSWNIPKMSPKPKIASTFFYDENIGTVTDHKELQNSGITDGHISSGWVASRIQMYEEARRGQYNVFNQQSNRLGLSQSGIIYLQYENDQLSNQEHQVNNKRRSNSSDYSTLNKGKFPPTSLFSNVQYDGGTLRTRAGIRSGKFKPGVNCKDPGKQEQLHNKLLSYSMFGMPRPSSTTCKFWEIREGDESSIYLEPTWKEIVLGHEDMTRKQCHQQEAIWELLHTELTYLKKLKVITDLFICGLVNLQQHGILNEVDPQTLFSNIPEIIRVHRKLWREVMTPALQEVRTTRKPFHPLSFVDGFKKFSERFIPYIQYCMEEDKCMENARILLRDNELFKIYVKWAETHKQCNRLRLIDMLVKPHQRITKYPLLLKAILKRTENPDDKDALFRMISNTEQFLHYINSKMFQREEQQKLASIACRIGAYEVLEPVSEEVEKHVKEFCSLNLTSPINGVGPDQIRQLLLEGTLKMKENKESKMEVYCFLFTDVFLITKLMKKTEMAKVIRQPLMVEQIVCRELKDPGTFLVLYLNEFQCIVLALTFQTSSSKDRTMWVDAINNAKDQLRKMKTEEADNREKELQRIIEDISQYNVPSSASPNLPHREGRGQQIQRSEFTTVKPILVITDEAGDLTDQDDSMETSSTGLAQSAVRTAHSPTSELNSNPAGSDSGTELPHSTKEAFTSSFASPRLQRRRVMHKKRKKQLSPSSVNVLDTAGNVEQFIQTPRLHGIIKAQDLLSSPGNNTYSTMTTHITLNEEETAMADDGDDDDDNDSSVGEVFIFVEPNLPIFNPENRRSPTVVETLLRAHAMERQWKNYCASDTMSFVSDNMSEFSDMEEIEFMKDNAGFDNTQTKAAFDNEAFSKKMLEVVKLTTSINSMISEAENDKIPVQSECFPRSKESNSLVPETASVGMEEFSRNHKESEVGSGNVYPCTMTKPQSLHMEETASIGANCRGFEIPLVIQKQRLLSADDVLTGNLLTVSPFGLSSGAYQHSVSREVFLSERTEKFQAHVTPDRVLTVADIRRLRTERQGFSC